jgi:hypothetical protein
MNKTVTNTSQAGTANSEINPSLLHALVWLRDGGFVRFPVAHHPPSDIVFSFCLKDIICHRAKSDIFNLATSFFYNFSSGCLLGSFTELQMSARQTPSTRTVRTYPLLYKKLTISKDKTPTPTFGL